MVRDNCKTIYNINDGSNIAASGTCANTSRSSLEAGLPRHREPSGDALKATKMRFVMNTSRGSPMDNQSAIQSFISFSALDS